MKEQTFSDNFSETIFKQAVIDDFEREVSNVLEDETPVVISERYERRMNTLFAKERRRDMFHRFLTVIPHVAAAFAVFVVLGILLMSVPVVRATVSSAILWLDEYTQFDSRNMSAERFLGEPSALPPGFSEVSRISKDGLFSIAYTNTESIVLLFTCVPESDSIAVNNESVEYGQSAVRGIIYHTFTATSDEYISSVVWDMGGSRFSIGAKLPIDDLLAIAQSVELTK